MEQRTGDDDELLTPETKRSVYRLGAQGGPWTSSLGISWEMVKNANLCGPILDLWWQVLRGGV